MLLNRETSPGDMAGPKEDQSSEIVLPESPNDTGRVEAHHSASEAKQKGGAFLRVVGAVDGAPVSELHMRLVLFGADAVDESGAPTPSILGHQFPVTGEDGSVDLLPILKGIGEAKIQSMSLLLLERCELILEPGVIRTSMLGATREDALEVLARQRPTAPIRGLAVDAQTQLPLPRIAMRIQRWLDLQDAASPRDSAVVDGNYIRSTQFFAGATAEWIVTDENGRFSTRAAFPAGRVGFLTIDQERTDGQHVLTAEGVALETVFKVPVGPRILLDFNPPGGRLHAQFIAGIWRAPEELVRDDGLQEFPSPWSQDGGSARRPVGKRGSRAWTLTGVVSPLSLQHG